MRTTRYIALTLQLLIATAARAEPRVIHVFVALCDNEHQGIVPVPKALGNGDDPGNNLCWGALYGTKTHLKKSRDWTLVQTRKQISEHVLERIVFENKTTGAYLIADAYRGRNIKQAITAFFQAAAGNNAATLKIGSDSIQSDGGANCIVYVGHNGLMEFDVVPPKPQKDERPQNAIVLACKSKPYFQPYLEKLGCKSMLLTTGLMAPEAYALEAALAGWLRKETNEKIKDRAARAYHKYQKCGLTAARRLFYTEQ